MLYPKNSAHYIQVLIGDKSATVPIFICLYIDK